jgi:hypothetical protein
MRQDKRQQNEEEEHKTQEAPPLSQELSQARLLLNFVRDRPNL